MLENISLLHENLLDFINKATFLSLDLVSDILGPHIF